MKSGYTSLTQRIRTQIAKDVALLESREAREVVWAFTRSPITGRIGASRPLLDALWEAGIATTYYL